MNARESSNWSAQLYNNNINYKDWLKRIVGCLKLKQLSKLALYWYIIQVQNRGYLGHLLGYKNNKISVEVSTEGTIQAYTVLYSTCRGLVFFNPSKNQYTQLNSALVYPRTIVCFC